MINGAATSVRSMCWATRAENNATLRLHKGETSDAARMAQPA
jgi:hypothetical protein